MLVIGGGTKRAEEGTIGDVQLGTIEGNCINWSLQSKLNTPRRGATADVVQNGLATLIYVSGGCDKPKSHLSSIECFSSGNWKLSNLCLAEGRSCHMSSVRNGKLFVFGGYNGADCLDSVECIDIASGENLQLQKLPGPIKNGVLSVNFDSVLLIGGWDGRRTLKTIFRYDLRTGVSEMVGLLPYPIECASIAETTESAYIIGGYNGIKVVDTVTRINKKSLQCEVLNSTLNTGRECHCSEIANQRLYVCGGWDGFQALNSVENLDLSTEETTFSLHGKLPLATNRPVSVFIAK